MNHHANTPRKNATKLIRFTLLFGISCITTLVVATESYRYTRPDGSVVFTDVPMSRGELSGQATGNGVTRTSYRGTYGRAPATGSCKGVNEQTLQKRYAQIAKFVDQAAASNSLDPLLIKAVARVESCFDTKAVSIAGARGVMQLMPATARGLGVANSFNAQQNIAGGSRYLASLLKRFDQNHELALAAYNAGPSAVERHGGVPPYRETRRYVPLVLSIYRRFTRAAATAQPESRG